MRPGEQRSGSDEVQERRVFWIESAFVALKWILKTGLFRLAERRTGNAVAVPLFPAFPDADGLPEVDSRSCPDLGTHEPEGLCEKGEKQQSGKKLRPAKTFTREIGTHKVEPSVLPCRWQLRKTFCDERSRNQSEPLSATIVFSCVFGRHPAFLCPNAVSGAGRASPRLGIRFLRRTILRAA